MTHYIKAAFFCSLLVSLPLISQEPKRHILSLKHIESGGIGYNTGYTTLQAFLCADPEAWKTFPFLDLRGHVLDNGTWAVNAGAGLRGVLKNRVYGINAYYDYRSTKHTHYNQAALGLETLGTFLDARINGYLPWGEKMSSPYDVQFYTFAGNSAILSQKREFAMRGADAELGFHWGTCFGWNFYAATGPYYFHQPIGPNAWGGKVRFNVSYKQYVSLELIDSYDNVFHNKVQGQIALSLPLGTISKKEKTKRTYSESLVCRMVQPVARNEMIVVNDKHQYPTAINPATGLPFTFIFVDNTSASNGTYESPYHSLAQAETGSSPNDVIYLFPGDGTTTNMDEGITLKPSQALWGSGISHPLQTVAGLVTIPQMTPTNPQITNVNLLGRGVTLSTNNSVAGLTITNTSGNAIYGLDPESITIVSCTFTGAGQGDMGIFPVYIGTSTPLIANINENLFDSNTNGCTSIVLNDGTTSASIYCSSNTATNNGVQSGSAALLTLDPNGIIDQCQLSMTNNFINNTNLNGVTISNLLNSGAGSFNTFSCTFTGNTVNNGGTGFYYGTNGEDISINISNNNLSDNTLDIISIHSGNARITNLSVNIDHNELNRSVTGGGITLSGPYDAFACTVTNNSITDNASTALLFYNSETPAPDMAFIVSGNIISNNMNGGSNAAGGISIDGFNTLAITIENNEFSTNTSGNKISYYSPPPVPENLTIVLKDNSFNGGDFLDVTYFGESPDIACITMSGNTSSSMPAYIFTKAGTGDFYITPCDYESLNTGDFSLTDVTPAQDCAGTACE